MREEKILANNVLTNCCIMGEGYPFLILHGWGGSSKTWEKVIEKLKSNFKLICPDLPGFGKTPPPDFDWSLKDYVVWLKDLLDALYLKDVILLGHSFGGRVAIKFSLSFPERIKILILLASAGIKEKLGIKGKVLSLFSFWGNRFFSFKPLFHFKKGAQKIFYFFLRDKDYVKASERMRGVMRNVINEDLLPHLPSIKNKTLILWGEIDDILSLKHAYLFYKNIPDSQIFIIPGVSHAPNLKNPDVLADFISYALKENI
jgi:pimeloyl-ACP methyl ester carboxylesterase